MVHDNIVYQNASHDMVHDIIVYQVMRIKNGQCYEGTLYESTLYEGTLYELKGNKGGRPAPFLGVRFSKTKIFKRTPPDTEFLFLPTPKR